MSLTLLLGGARSGKSALAVRLASEQPRPVVYVATAEASDDEMVERIERHRLERPSAWSTVEERFDLEGVLVAADPSAVVVVDCLTLWVTNVFGEGDEPVLDAARLAARVAAQRAAPTIVVSNEVGSGIVPVGAETRRWRDLLGRVNAAFAEVADRAFLVVAGRVLPLQRVEDALVD